ncbi:Tyrosine kinase [Entamoeba marina]
MLVFLCIALAFAYCDHYNNNTLIYEPNKQCIFDSNIYTYTISTYTTFQFLDSPTNLTILSHDSHDIDILLGYDKMKNMIIRKQSYASLQYLTINSYVQQQHKTISLSAIELENPFHLNILIPNTTVKLMFNNMENPINYHLTSVDNNEFVFLKTPHPLTDQIILEGNITVGLQKAISIKRTTCNTLFVGVGNVTTKSFHYSYHGVDQLTDSVHSICQRENFKRYTDCDDSEFNNYLDQKLDGCGCRFLWMKNNDIHYDKWDCNMYSKHLNLLADMKNTTIKGEWKNVLANSTTSTLIDTQIDVINVVNSLLIGTLNTDHVIVFGNVRISTLNTKEITIMEKSTLWINNGSLPTGWTYGNNREGYYEVINTQPHSNQNEVEL